MDIYQESITFLGEDAHFDNDGFFQCEVSSDANEHDGTFSLAIFKNEATSSLHISLTSPVELPTPLPEAIAITIGEHALEPFRGEIGIGLMPGSRRITIYKVISLSDNPQDFLQTTLHQLLEKMEQWHLFIELQNNEEINPQQKSVDSYI